MVINCYSFVPSAGLGFFSVSITNNAISGFKTPLVEGPVPFQVCAPVLGVVCASMLPKMKVVSVCCIAFSDLSGLLLLGLSHKIPVLALFLCAWCALKEQNL